MMLSNFHKKESPILGLAGYGGGVTRIGFNNVTGESYWYIEYFNQDLQSGDQNGGRFLSTGFDSSNNAYAFGYWSADGNDRNNKVMISKIDSEAQVQWIKLLDADQTGTNYVSSQSYSGLVDPSDGSLYFTGTVKDLNLTYRSVFTGKLSADGTLVWSSALRQGTGSTENADGNSIALDSNGNIYVAGLGGGDHTLLAKYSSDGTLQWERLYNFYEADIGDGGRFNAIAIDSSDNIYCVGSARNKTNNVYTTYGIIHKYDTDGNLSFQKSYGPTTGGGELSFRGVKIDSSGNIIAVGYHTHDPGGFGSFDGLIAKFDSSGTLLWDKQYGRSGGYTLFNDVDIDSSGNIYIVSDDYLYWTDDGYSDYSWIGLIIKYNSSGTHQWSRRVYRRNSFQIHTGYTLGVKVHNDILYVTGGFGRLSDVFASIMKYPVDGSITGMWWNLSTYSKALEIQDADSAYSDGNAFNWTVNTTTKTAITNIDETTPTVTNTEAASVYDLYRYDIE